jgi:ABC-type dipeptide/oligopeptide/nickel transport system permease subunit
LLENFLATTEDWVMFTVLGLNLLGDWLREHLDPTGGK